MTLRPEHVSLHLSLLSQWLKTRHDMTPSSVATLPRDWPQEACRITLRGLRDALKVCGHSPKCRRGLSSTGPQPLERVSSAFLEAAGYVRCRAC